MIHLRTPTQLRLDDLTPRRDEIAKELKYIDKKLDYQIRKFKSNAGWHIRRLGKAAYDLSLADMVAQREKSLLFQDDTGLWTYSGLAHSLSDTFDVQVKRDYVLPEPNLIPYAKVPDKKPRYYQEKAAEELIAAAEFGPAGVEMGTGLGKSFILQMLLKHYGLKALVMAPSISIAEQLFDQCTEAFGKAKVGMYGDGKKSSNKLITVGIAASLNKIEKGSDAWNDLVQAKVFIADESHMCPASTLAHVCFGVAGDAPYRFFFSGTQMRNDGLDLVLDAITGPIVYRMTVKEGVDKGFLSQPKFRMCWTRSNVREESSDPNDLTRAHIYYNDELNAKVGELINKAVSVMGRPTLILVEEIPQFTALLPHLRFEARFAHGGVTKENKEFLPEAYHKSDPKALVKAFNAGEYPILVGTSCIATGTDIQATQSMFYLRGGKSETEVKQGVGRCTRLFAGKENCIVFDVGIENVEVLRNHATARKEIYADIYPDYKAITI